MVQLPNILFFHVDNLGFGELSLLQRWSVPRHVDEADRCVRFARHSAHELRTGSPVHAYSVRVVDRSLCDPIG